MFVKIKQKFCANVPFRISILFQYFMYVLDKVNTFSTWFWKLISSFNTFSILHGILLLHARQYNDRLHLWSIKHAFIKKMHYSLKKEKNSRTSGVNWCDQHIKCHCEYLAYLLLVWLAIIANKLSCLNIRKELTNTSRQSKHLVICACPSKAFNPHHTGLTS